MANGGGPFGIGNQILQGFLGDETLRDYRHASKTFTSNQFELKPRFKFLFHVTFTINTSAIEYLRAVFGETELRELSLLVKSADLPKFNVDTEVIRQYNRKRVVQTGINYQPVTLTFHDDGGDNARRLWYYYFTYYYKDAIQPYETPGSSTFDISQTRQPGFDYNARDIYADTQQVKDWGFVGESSTDGIVGASGKPPFFRDIRIYGLDQHKYGEYVLINPVIKYWGHDQYEYADTGTTMQHTMTLEYETVKYYAGNMSANPQGGDNNVSGFGDEAHYDTRRSPISRPGGNQTVFGQGGLLSAIGSIGQDLSGEITIGGLLNAAATVERTRQTFKGQNVGRLAGAEAKTAVAGAIIDNLPAATRYLANSPVGINIPLGPNRT